MDRLDERLRHGLKRLSEPVSAGPILESVARRKSRKRLMRRVEAAALVVVVIIGLLTGTYGLLRVFGTQRPRPATEVRVPVGGSPVDIAVGDGSVWVATLTDSSGRGDVVRINPTDGRVLARISVPEIGALAVGPSGVWVANPHRGTITRIDTDQNEMADAIAMPPLSYEVAEGDYSFVPNHVAVGFGRVWVSTARGSVASFDPATGEMREVASDPRTMLGGVTTGAGSVWAWNYYEPPEADVWRLSPESGELERISVPDTVQDATAGSAGLYVLHVDTGEVSLVGSVDPVQRRVVDAVRVGSAGERAYALAVADSTVFVAAAAGNIYAIDQATGDRAFLTRLPTEPTALEVADDALWVAAVDGSVIRVPLERDGAPEPTLAPRQTPTLTPTKGVAPCTAQTEQMKQADTRLGKWLLRVLERVGAPEGWKLARNQISEPDRLAGSGFLLEVPEYAKRFDVALFAEPLDPLNPIHGVPGIARSGEWRLHGGRGRSDLQQFVAASPELQIVVHVFPKRERMRQQSMVDWFHRVVEAVGSDPPPRECVSGNVP